MRVRTVIAAGVLFVAACSSADDRPDLSQVLGRLEAEFGPDGMSAGARSYYEDLYGPSFGADEIRFANLSDPDGPRSPLGLSVILLAKDDGYERSDLDALAAEIGAQTGGPSPVLIHEGVAIIILGGDDETAALVRGALE